MMKALLTIYSMMIPMLIFAQDKQDSTAWNYYVVLYTTGENWDSTLQTHEQLYFKEHSAHLAELRRAGKIGIGGRFNQTGLILLKAKDDEEASDWISSDMAVKNNVFTAEIHSFNPFYDGCVEKIKDHD